MTEIYQHRFGDCDCTIINIGQRDYAGDVIFGNIPAAKRRRVFAELGIENARVSLSNNIVYLKTQGHEILVDAGNRILSGDLQCAGIHPGNISHMILTHGHGSHMVGLFDEAGELVFPNAVFVCGRQEWAYRTGDEQLNKADRTASLWRQLFHKLSPEQLLLVEPEETVLPGIHVVAAPGHTPGQIGLLISTQEVEILHIADAAHHTFQVAYPHWSSDFDSDLGVARDTRQALFRRAEANNLLVLGYHFAAPGLGYIAGDRWQPFEDEQVTQ